MAIRLADYYPNHLRKIRIIAATVGIAILVFITAILLNTGHTLTFVLLEVVLPTGIVLGIVFFLLLHYALEPLDMVTRAITHVSPQQSDVTPPDINEPRHETSGLKQMIQTVYDRTPVTDLASTTTDIADLLPCGIMAFNAAGELVFANKPAPVITGAGGSRAMTLQFIGNDTLDAWQKDAVDQKMSDEHIWQGIADAGPEDQNRRIFDVVAYYQKNATNGFETIIVTVDRTATYVDDEESIDFISLAAHELRGPITIIRGYLDVLMHELQPSLQGDQKELMERLDVSAARLSGYVNNILNVAKYDRRHLQLHLAEDRLSDIYAIIADDLQLRARTQARVLSVTIPSDLPTIAADRNSLSEVLANLVDNALKYSKEGGVVEVTASVDGSFIRCFVKDSGIGIPTSVMGNLFSKFYRSHRSRTTVSGTGLGLYISKGIIESHGGQISASSKEGDGSVFTFSVPIYATVADKLASGNNGNEAIIETPSGWIRNHGKIGG